MTNPTKQWQDEAERFDMTKTAELLVDFAKHINDAETLIFTEQPEKETALWNLIEAYNLLEKIIKTVGHPRFEPETITTLVNKPISTRFLNCCPYCGHVDCQSDHK